MVLALAGGAITMIPASASAPGPEPAAIRQQDCEAIIRGAVIRDQDYERHFGDDLVFRLTAAANAPPNPQEWRIEVRPAAFPEHEYTYYASPPFRFWNPRYIGTSYGYTAVRAVEHGVREFRFLTNEEDYARARRAIEVVLWPGNYSRAEYDAEVRTLGELAKGRGTFRILDSRLTPPTAERPLGGIERLEFEVTLCLPRTR
jgi:hypothetical protein